MPRFGDCAMSDLTIEDGYVRITMRGEVTLDELIARNHALFEMMPDARVGRQLWDYTAVTRTTYGAAELTRLIDLAARRADESDRIRIALLANSALAFGLSRMYSVLAEDAPWETRVFDDERDALAWLGVS